MSEDKPVEIFFYQLMSKPLEKALPQLLERSVERGWNVVLQTRPHGMAQDGDPEVQPIYLTFGPENPNGAQVRFFVESAQIAPSIAAREEPYERLVIMFDGNNEAELTDARVQWKALKDSGATLAYYQQTEEGRWEKKA